MAWMEGLNSYSYCLEIFIAVFMYMIWLKRRNHFGVRVIISLLILLAAALFINPVFNAGVQAVTLLWFVFVFVLDCGLCHYCCEVSSWDAILTVSLGYAVQHLTSSVYLLLIYRGGIPVWSGWQYLVIYAVIYAASYLLLVRRITETGTFESNASRSLIAALIILSVSIVLSFFVKISSERVMAEASGIAFHELFRYCQIYSVLVSLFLIWNERIQQRELAAREKLTVNNMIWQQRQQQYQTSKDNIEVINRKCHDLKHQIAALAVAQDSSEQRQNYIRELQDMIEVYDTAVETGNDALDTLLMERGLFCHMHGIDWTCVVDGNWLTFVDVIDLYTMLGNALDNAQEAVLQIKDKEKRMIAVRIWKQDAFIVIRVENSYQGTLRMQEGKLLTSKKDKANHGYGVRSIRNIAEKYGGTVSIKTEEIFLLNILLPIKA